MYVLPKRLLCKFFVSERHSSLALQCEYITGYDGAQTSYYLPTFAFSGKGGILQYKMSILLSDHYRISEQNNLPCTTILSIKTECNYQKYSQCHWLPSVPQCARSRILCRFKSANSMEILPQLLIFDVGRISVRKNEKRRLGM